MPDDLDFDLDTMRPVPRDTTPPPAPPRRQVRPRRDRITSCRDCGGIVSKHAKCCPHCGSHAFDAASAAQHHGFALLRFGLAIIATAIALYLLRLAAR